MGEVLQVWVAPEYRGAGVATGLLDAILRWAETNGFREIKAAVTPGNEGALRFYQKCGFRLLDGVSLSTDGADDLVMTRKLG
ncbi:MAG TPA: GNAT family N-acetyltransferase [Chloroflexi bacterium]|nr:GNAT family N-acetyltransferase [Chloroflexota bacterium]